MRTVRGFFILVALTTGILSCSGPYRTVGGAAAGGAAGVVGGALLAGPLGAVAGGAAGAATGAALSARREDQLR
jgi:outer membrane lipoprotein SlyB